MYWFNICTAYTVYVISDSALTDAMQIAESDSALSLVYYKLNIFYFILFYFMFVPELRISQTTAHLRNAVFLFRSNVKN